MSTEPAAGTTGTGGHRMRPLAILAAVALAVLAGWALGRLTAPAPSFPVGSAAEAGFARDMQVHHLQAVEMSTLIRDRTDNPDVRLLAYDIARSQQQQAGQMFGWLAIWGLPQASSTTAMAWMNDRGPSGPADGHSAHGGGAEAPVPAAGALMPGMATAGELAALEASTGPAAERLYLELMIRHHQAGVAMAQGIVDRSDNAAVTSLARSVITAQQSEVDYMFQLLMTR